jgi:Protein of unknown function (DUF2934)
MDNARLQEEIAKVAYELYERRGRVPGYAAQDWLDAEKIVMSRHKTSDVKEAAPKAARKKTAGAPKAGKAGGEPAKPRGRKSAGRKKEQ